MRCLSEERNINAIGTRDQRNRSPRINVICIPTLSYIGRNIPAPPREVDRDEDQAGYRLHAGRSARVFRAPEIKPLQEELLKEVRERLSANIKAMDPEAMLKTWLPATLKGFEQLQEMFLSRMGGAGGKRK